MVTIDTTIAVIALPSMQSNLAASPEQATWILTSYMIAVAIFMPLSGWLANKFGRGPVLATSVAIFTLSSIGCGVSASIEMLVLFRFIQGASGASIQPLISVLLLDINPPHKHPQAIAIFTIGTLCGPMIGPTLGGWLTENVSWHAIFLINAPIGVISFLGLVVFVRDKGLARPERFDLPGFLMVAGMLGSFQLMIDRGQMLDWLGSTEIVIEAVMCATFGYLAVVHMFTAKNPFIKPAIFADRNFVIGSVLSALIGILLSGVTPIMVAMMQNVLGYPVMLTGYLSLPRSLGNMLTVVAIVPFSHRMDARVPIVVGMALLIWSLFILGDISLDVRQESLAWAAFLQGCGSGLLFMPLMLIVFSTLPVHLRNEGSTIFSLSRSVASAVGLSLLQTMTIREAAAQNSHLVEGVRGDNPIVAWSRPDFDVTDVQAIGDILRDIGRQAEMIAYVDVFRALLIIAAVLTPLCLFLRTDKLAQQQQASMPAD